MVAVQFIETKLGDKEMVEEGEGRIVHMGIAAVDGVSPNLVRRGDFVLVPLVVQTLDYLLCRGFYCHLL